MSRAGHLKTLIRRLRASRLESEFLFVQMLGSTSHWQKVPTTPCAAVSLKALWDWAMAAGFLFNGIPVSRCFLLSSGQNKTEVRTEHRGKEWENQEQNKTEEHAEWDEGEGGCGSPSRRGSTSNRSHVPKHTPAPLPTRLSGELSSTGSQSISL